jgi:hypothetical protein
MSNFFSRLFCDEDKGLNDILKDLAADKEALEALQDISCAILQSAYDVAMSNIHYNNVQQDKMDIDLLKENTESIVRGYIDAVILNNPQFNEALINKCDGAISDLFSGKTTEIDYSELADEILNSCLSNQDGC